MLCRQSSFALISCSNNFNWRQVTWLRLMPHHLFFKMDKTQIGWKPLLSLIIIHRNQAKLWANITVPISILLGNAKGSEHGRFCWAHVCDWHGYKWKHHLHGHGWKTPWVAQKGLFVPAADEHWIRPDLKLKEIKSLWRVFVIVNR